MDIEKLRMERSKVIPFERKAPDRLRPLNVPVPPTFEEAICYPGDERYVALWWSRCGEDIIYDDGYRSGTGHSFGWMAFARHRVVAPILSRLDYLDYDRGDHPGTERLLLDRYQRRFYAGGANLVMDTVKRENNIPAADTPPLVLSKKQLDELAAGFRKVTTLPAEELDRRMQELRCQIGEMLCWLDHSMGQPA